MDFLSEDEDLELGALEEEENQREPRQVSLIIFLRDWSNNMWHSRGVGVNSDINAFKVKTHVRGKD